MIAPAWLTPELIITVLLLVVVPFLLIGWVLWMTMSMRQVKDAIAYLAWRDHGGPAPRQRGNVLPFRRRSG